jgi:hypothetical protein
MRVDQPVQWRARGGYVLSKVSGKLRQVITQASVVPVRGR